MNNSAICLLCVKPNKIHVDFFNSISNYKLFMLCDDNNCKTDIQTIEFIKIDDNECFSSGFKNSNYFVDKNPSAWDKVFYYFSKINSHKYDYVWILEDDVFVPNNDAFWNLEIKYGYADLLCRSNLCNSSKNEWQLWNTAQNHELPWYSSIVCCCRISNKLFTEIGKYVEEKGELFFIETMINTIANHKKLVIKEVEEFENIIAKASLGNRYRHFSNGKIIWMTKSIPNIKENFLYHPVKNIELQEVSRIKK